MGVSAYAKHREIQTLLNNNETDESKIRDIAAINQTLETLLQIKMEDEYKKELDNYYKEFKDQDNEFE